MRQQHLRAVIAAGILASATGVAHAQRANVPPGDRWLQFPLASEAADTLRDPASYSTLTREPASGGASAPVTDARTDVQVRTPPATPPYAGSAEEDEEMRRGYRPGGPAWETRRNPY